MIRQQKMLIAAYFLSANCILTSACSSESSYFQAYKDFLLNTEVDQGSDFPVWGY